jgi:putative transposase
VTDGLKGLPDAINTVWPAAIVQACVLHLIRNSFHYAGRHDWEKMAKDLRPIYQAINADVAAAQLEEFASIWGQKYPAIVRLWRSAWPEFTPFLEYGACRRIGA